MLIPIGDNIDRRDFPVVPILLIVANVFVFAFEYRLLSGASMATSRAFFTQWGLVPSALAEGKGVITLFTHMFMHGGLMHLLGNMMFLWAFSCSLEIGLGRLTLLCFYFVFGLAGGLAHFAMHIDSAMPLVGASGAIAGLIGAYTVLFGYKGKIRMMLLLGWYPLRFNVPAWLFGGGWILWQLHLADVDPDLQGGVAWHCHIGGFIAGVLVMFMCRNDTNGELQSDGLGGLILNRNEPAENDEHTAYDGTIAAMMPECPHCCCRLSEDNRVAGTLARCGNADCERLIYLDQHDGPQPTARSRQ
jgi:membrane associated rhomboid family serine protease